jgi:hypothetical protein
MTMKAFVWPFVWRSGRRPVLMVWMVWAASIASIATLVLGLAACGGAGTDGTGPSENSVNVGVLKGLAESSVTVNGITYDMGGATVQDGFGQRVGTEALRLGMWVEVSGGIDEATGTARALSIRIRPAARGLVSAVDSGKLTVTLLQSSARVDEAATVIEGVDRATKFAPGDVVEVHGPLGAGSGTVEASRIERLASGLNANKPVELRGRVGALDPIARTLTVGRQPVFYGDATLTVRRALAAGQVVRVSAFAPPPADPREPWRVERVTSDQALPDNLGFVYAEGVTTEWVTGPSFRLEDVPVDATAATNRQVVTGESQRVAVIGSLAEGVLKAKSVALLRPGQPAVFVLGGSISSYRSIADLRVRGVLVDARAAVLVGGTAADFADGRRVRVTGTISGQTLIATRVEFQ